MALEPFVESHLGFSSSLMVPIIGAVISLALLYWWQENQRISKYGEKIPGPRRYPFIGNAHLFIGKTHHEIMTKVVELGTVYGNTARAWVGNRLVVFLTHPDDVEIILNSHVHIDKAEDYQFFKPWLGDGLLISSGDRWRSHRKLIVPAFHLNVLKSFVDTFNKNSLNVVKRMEKEIGKEFDVHDYMSETTVDILLETAMGTKKTHEDSEGFNYAMAVMKMCDLIHSRHIKIHLRPERLFRLFGGKNKQDRLLGIIHGLTTKVIKTKNAIYDKNMQEGILPSPSLAEIIAQPTVTPSIKKPATIKGLRDDLDDNDENDIGEKRRLAFLDLMIETAKSGANLTDRDIKEQVDTIMFEGHDTTAAGSSFFLCLMGIHQHIQARCYDELKTIFGDSARPPTFADTLEMKYLERVILETLRMYPPVPVIARKLNEDIKLATRDLIVPAGTTVVIGTFKTHRNPEYYPNPTVFNPDNFLPERMASRHYYSFIPFSAGPRSCVGRKYAILKLKVLLSTILRNYKINSTLTEADFKLQADIILKRTDGFRIEIEPRKHNIVTAF